QSIAVLMNSAPLGVDIDELVAAIAGLPDVCEVHHLHLWEIDERQVSLEAHIVVAREQITRMEEIKLSVKTVLADKFGIGHSTLEFELDGHSACTDAGPSDLIPHH
ncbi:MAG: cation transporter, partial [Planctomycetales bacterium]|nr:cation transporter [Planctomycetales bacterium]